MVNYSNSIIYKLCCLDPTITDIYIGSTTSKYRRKNQHKSSCNNKSYNRTYLYQFINQHGGWLNWDFVEIEQYNAKDKSDLHKRERHWIETLKSTLNKIIPEKRDDELSESYKQKRERYGNITVNCECGLIIKWVSKTSHKTSKIHRNYLESQKILA